MTNRDEVARRVRLTYLNYSDAIDALISSEQRVEELESIAKKYPSFSKSPDSWVFVYLEKLGWKLEDFDEMYEWIRNHEIGGLTSIQKAHAARTKMQFKLLAAMYALGIKDEWEAQEKISIASLEGLISGAAEQRVEELEAGLITYPCGCKASAGSPSYCPQHGDARLKAWSERNSFPLDIPMVKRATGRTIPDLTKMEHVCEWQNSVRAEAAEQRVEELGQMLRELVDECTTCGSPSLGLIDKCEAALSPKATPKSWAYLASEPPRKEK